MKNHLLALVVFVNLQSACVGSAVLSMPPNKAELDAAAAAGSPVAISAIYGERGYGSAIDVAMTWKNTSATKTIKYCWFDVEFINGVGDLVASEIGGKTAVTLKDTGPHKPGKTVWGGMNNWPRAFYHANATTLRLKSVRCEYMDGEKTPDVLLTALPAATGKIGAKP